MESILLSLFTKNWFLVVSGLPESANFQRISWRIYHHPLCRRSHAELFYVDLLQFLLRPDLDIYLRNKKKQKQNNQFISNQLSQTNIVLSKINFKCELLCSYCLHELLHTFSFFHFSFSRKKKCEFAKLRLNGLFRSVVVVSNLQ